MLKSKFIKPIKYVLCVIIFLALMFGINELFRFLVIDDVKSYSRIMLHELYHQDENVDVLFLGTSHCYRSLDPHVTDEIFHCNTFNAGTSLQGLDGSYTLLKEANNHHQLKKVYVELFYGVTGETYKDRVAQNATYLISDYMKPSWNKYSYIYKSADLRHFSNGIILGHRNWEKLFDWKYVSNLVSQKTSPSYRNYEYITDITDAYTGKGFVESYIKMGSDAKYESSNEFFFEEDYISKDCQNTIKDIIAYCQKHNIELVFFESPMADYYISSTHNYDSYVTQVHALLDSYNIPFYDFNLCKSEYLNITDDDYMDSHHLNNTGAVKFSTVFAKFFTNELGPEIFYDSFSQKILTEDKPLLGFIIEQMKESQVDPANSNYDFANYTYYAITPLSATPHKYEYFISKWVHEENYPIQDWSSNPVIIRANDEHGTFCIDTRIAGTNEILSTTNFEY